MSPLFRAHPCGAGNLFKTSFGGTNFALCASGTDGFIAHSSDMTVIVEYFCSPVHVLLPASSDEPKSYTTVASVKPVSLTALALCIFTENCIPSSTSRNLKTAEHMAMEASTCMCRPTPRPCFFLFHGIGNKKEKAELQDKPCVWMGSIGDHAPCCSTVKCAWTNTMDYSWANDVIQKKFCNHELSMSDTSDLTSATVDDTIIIMHSMGGLVKSTAFASGKCSFGANPSWVALRSPMTGSIVADYAPDVCNDEFGVIVVDLMDVIG